MIDLKQVVRRRSIETSYYLYDTFFDFPWAEGMMRRLADTRLAKDFDDLCISWREAVGFHRFPWMMIETTIGTVGGFMHGDKSSIRAYSFRLRDRFLKGVGAGLSHSKRRETLELIDSVFQEVAADDAFHQESLRRELWQSLIRQSEIQWGIFGSQSLAYCGACFRVRLVHHGYLPTNHRRQEGSDKRTKYWKVLDDT